MEQYILKSAVVEEIEMLQRFFVNERDGFEKGYHHILRLLKSFLDTLEVKEIVECEQPEYSYFETIYQCGKKPHWNIGDTLAYYEFYSDREGEYVLGKVTKVDFDKEQCDWLYTFEGGKVYDEQSLLEEETYKKN